MTAWIRWGPATALPSRPGLVRRPGLAHMTAAGLAAILVGIGLARFAYAPLVPALVAAHWFAAAQTAYLGAANLAGYLVGAVAARPLARMAGTRPTLRLMMLLAATGFAACAAPWSFAWYFGWRFAAGVAGGVLMVLAAPVILAQVPAPARGRIGGLIFTGVGVGIVASGTLIPRLLRAGLPATWLALGGLALGLTILAWGGWPSAKAPSQAGAGPAGARLPQGVPTVLAIYGLIAVGLVPHMIFLVDFVARGRGLGIDVGADYWIVYGIGATAGPFLAGWAGDALGFARAQRLALAMQAVAAALPALVAGSAPWVMPALGLSALVMGAFTSGMVPLVLGRLGDLAGAERHAQVWALATVVFAIGQAAAAWVFSALFAWSGDYAGSFLLAAGALVLALLIDVAAGIRQARRRRRGCVPAGLDEVLEG